MVKLLKFQVLLAVICVASCKPKTTTGPTIIKINEKDLINIPLDQVLSGSEFIPLEFTPESALSAWAGFLNCTSGFYLMDNHQKKAVYQFDLQGRFIRTIGQAGKGPGEYPYFSDALIAENGLEILSRNPQSDIYKFGPDGRFIQNIRILEYPSYSFARNPENGNYYFYAPMCQHLIQQVDDKSLQSVDSFVVKNIKLMEAGGSTFGSTTRGGVLFYQSFDDRIFQIDQDTAIIRYRFDVGSSTPKYDELNRESQMKLLHEGVFWFIYKALENSGWLYLLINKQDSKDETQSQFYALLYEKKTGKLYRLPDTPEPEPLFYPAFGLGEDNVLYTSVQPTSICESDLWKSEFKKRGIILNPEGNMIVVKIPLGEILPVKN
jgi:hypothetical protein